MKNINEIVAGNIRSFRMEQGFTQELLALKSGLHRSYIGQVERCEKRIGLTNLQIIAETLNIDIKDFLDERL